MPFVERQVPALGSQGEIQGPSQAAKSEGVSHLVQPIGQGEAKGILGLVAQPRDGGGEAEGKAPGEDAAHG